MTPPLTGQLIRFTAVGIGSTGLFLVIYLVLRTLLTPTAANVVATVITTMVGTGANGRITFGVESTIGPREHLKGLAIAGVGLAITTAAVNAFSTGSTLLELVVLTAAGAVAGGLRFALLRYWVFTAGAQQPPSHTTFAQVRV